MSEQKKDSTAAAQKAAERYKDYPVREGYAGDFLWEELRGWHR